MSQSYSPHNLYLRLKKSKNLVLYSKLINIVDVQNLWQYQSESAVFEKSDEKVYLFRYKEKCFLIWQCH